jgi:hypothetical protein
MKFSEYPKEINGFKRESNPCRSNADFNYVSYSRGNDLGYVTADDLSAGRLQVRKIDQVKPGDGTRKVAVPSDRIW